MNKTIAIFILLFSITKGFSQKDSITKNILKNITVYPSIGVSYQKQIVGEIGVLVAKSDGKPWDEVLRLGVACGTATAMSPGKNLCHVTDIETILPQVMLERLE